MQASEVLSRFLTTVVKGIDDFMKTHTKLTYTVYVGVGEVDNFHAATAQDEFRRFQSVDVKVADRHAVMIVEMLVDKYRQRGYTVENTSYLDERGLQRPYCIMKIIAAPKPEPKPEPTNDNPETDGVEEIEAE